MRRRRPSVHAPKVSHTPRIATPAASAARIKDPMGHGVEETAAGERSFTTSVSDSGTIDAGVIVASVVSQG